MTSNGSDASIAQQVVEQMYLDTVPGARLKTKDGKAPFVDPLLSGKPTAYKTILGGFFHIARFKDDMWKEKFADGMSAEVLRNNGFCVKPTLARRIFMPFSRL